MSNNAQVEASPFTVQQIPEAPIVMPQKSAPITLASIMKKPDAAPKTELVQQTVVLPDPELEGLNDFYFTQAMPDVQPYTQIKPGRSLNSHFNITEKLSEFSNVAAIVIILTFAAIYRTKGFDIAGLLVRE